MADYERIETAQDLEALSNELLKQKVVAFDTEADSFYHYFDKTCLVQIAARNGTFLVDPLALDSPEELAPLGRVMASPDVRKVFHAAEYDIYVLKRDYGFRFANLFDTMVSAQLLGYPAIGLSAIVERHFGISLPKDEQRSDWSARPLRESQLTYAAADVTHLIALAKDLEKGLRSRGRLEWAQEEFEALTRREWPERNFDKLGYLKIKGARTLEPEGLAVLRELYLVRDRRAREIDRPAFKVLANRALLEIAQRLPTDEADLARVNGVSDLILRRFGREVLRAVERGIKRPHGPIPKHLGTNGQPRRRMDRRTERRLAALKRWRTTRAKELEMDPGVLCPNSALEAMAFRNPGSPEEIAELPEVKGWFGRSFGAEVAEVLRADGEAGEG